MKTAFAILSFAPILFWIAFMFVSPFLEESTQPQGLFTFWDLYPGTLGEITVFAILIGLFFSIYLAINVLRGNFAPTEKKKLWVALLILGNIIVLPFFWTYYIRKKPVI
jgi:hypothetical protein